MASAIRARIAAERSAASADILSRQRDRAQPEAEHCTAPPAADFHEALRVARYCQADTRVLRVARASSPQMTSVGVAARNLKI